MSVSVPVINIGKLSKYAAAMKMKKSIIFKISEMFGKEFKKKVNEVSLLHKY